ncbi:MAG: hypothetical protein ACLURI_06250, partial [Roseburia inulinivorans]
SLESRHCDFKRQCQLDFEITMDAFLVPLPATTSGSAPENKQFYFLYFYTLCWHAINITCENP